jgi:hypothetical protein
MQAVLCHLAQAVMQATLPCEHDTLHHMSHYARLPRADTRMDMSACWATAASSPCSSRQPRSSAHCNSYRLPLQVCALPQYYAERQDGCEIPDQAYGNHQPPEADSDVEIMVEDAQGNMATSWRPGGTYTVTTRAYGSQPVNAWVHANQGAGL